MTSGDESGDPITAGQDEALVTGWEPTLPDDDSVLRQFVLAMADRLTAEAEAGEGTSSWDDDLVLVDTGSPVVFENALLVRRPPAPDELPAWIDRARAFFPAGRPWALLSPFPLPDLRPNGMAPIGHPPFMVRPAGGEAPSLPPGLEIDEVHDVQTLAAWDDTFRVGYGLDHLPPAFGPGTLTSGLRCFLARLDGDAVGTAAAFSSRGITEVTLVATLAEARGRGIGEALTWAATLAEPDLPAALIASDDGFGVYRRMGYLPVLRMTMWAGPS